jgi:hypothetical protein
MITNISRPKLLDNSEHVYCICEKLAIQANPAYAEKLRNHLRACHLYIYELEKQLKENNDLKTRHSNS